MKRRETGGDRGADRIPRSEERTELRAVRLAMKHWQKYARCGCSTKNVKKVKETEGLGCDLRCPHLCVEVKGTRQTRPTFRYLTRKEHLAAKSGRRFEVWLVIFSESNHAKFHIITGKKVIKLSKPEKHWQLRLNKGDLAQFGELAARRKKLWKQGTQQA